MFIIIWYWKGKNTKAANTVLKVWKRPICQCQTDCLIDFEDTVPAASVYLYPAMEVLVTLSPLCLGERFDLYSGVWTVWILAMTNHPTWGVSWFLQYIAGKCQDTAFDTIHEQHFTSFLKFNQNAFRKF